ncbi:MAG TPA: hypothetical protein VF505_00220 [Thermoanaerobaculia bacterium]|jgi:hypothetical protein
MSGHLIARYVHAIWLGSGLFLIAVAAPAAFRGAPNSTIAADVVGIMLSRWHYLALGAPLLLLVLDWRRGRIYVLAIVFVGILLAAGQVVADLKIRSIRAASPVPISDLSREDPVRRQFGRLHGISSLLLLMQVIAAGVALAMDREAYPQPPVISTLSGSEGEGPGRAEGAVLGH